MPSYKVLQPGFFDGVLHKPGHPRHGVVNTEKPLKPVPTWLEPIKAESAAAKKKRAAAAKKAADDKAAADKDIENASFLGDGESAGGESGAVETL